MSQRALLRLRDRYPTASRMTLWRMRKQPGFPAAVVILGTEYFYEDEMEGFEEARRRLTPKGSAAEAATTAK